MDEGAAAQWFSTMYGVYYFAGSVWMTLATVYVITMILDRQGVLTDVLHEHSIISSARCSSRSPCSTLTSHFAQYFIIWNAQHS